MNLPALPAVAAPSAPGTPPKNADEPGAAGFAKCLDDAREGQAGAAGASDLASDVASEPASEPTTGQTDNAPPEERPRLRAQGLADRARKDVQRTGGLATADTKGSDPAADVRAAPDSGSKQPPADIASLLPGWTGAALPPTSTPAPVPDQADGGDIDDASPPARRGSARAAPSAQDDAAPRTGSHTSLDKTATASLPTPAQDAAPARQASAALEAATPRMREPEPGIVIAAPATSPSTLSTLHRPDAVATAHVAAALDTPAFAPALATQLRWLAQERVQQAQITLNPAGMGPVAVQIVIDGANARIDFSADQAATRQAIEASLPVLAAALDESGLKLSGGGVHDGGAQRHPAWGAPAAAHRTPADLAESEDGARGFGAAPRASVGRGLVDLVA